MRLSNHPGDTLWRRGRPPNAGHFSLPVTAKLHSTCMPTRRLDIVDIFQLGLFGPDRASPHHRTELEQTNSGRSDDCFQLSDDGHTSLFVTAELFSHFMPTRSDTLLPSLTDALKQTDMDRCPYRTTEQEKGRNPDRPLCKNYIKSVDIISPSSILLLPSKSPPSTSKLAQGPNANTQQIKMSDQQIQVIIKSHNVAVNSIPCIALILFDSLSAFCTQLYITVCNMLKLYMLYMLSASFNMIILNLNMNVYSLLLSAYCYSTRK